MSNSKMTAAILAALALASLAGHAPLANAQSSSPTQDDSSGTDADAPGKVKRLDTITVSGSLINNAQIQTATPTYTITAADIKARGFNSVSEALQSSVFSTGSVEGPQQNGGFTQGAQTISLYGLSPEYTLTLIDGKPITQFGQLYNGQSNFTNISNIPLSMIDHIDVIPGGGSSIYGSAAIAGVVNIVTKQHMDGAEVLVRAGGYDGGGGGNQRVALSFGHDFGKLNVLGSLEFDNSSPIWAYQRPFTALSPRPSVVALMGDYGTLSDYTGAEKGYVSPADGCAAMSGLFDGSTLATHSSVTSRTGTYCGARNAYGYTTLQNQQRSYDGMLKLKYDLSQHVRLYSDMLVDWQQQKWTPGYDFNWWGPIDYPGGYIEDAGTGHILYPERFFGPEEVGNGYYNQLGRQDDLMYQADIGANGTFGDSNWSWDVYFLRSGDRTTSSTPERMAAAVDGYFNSVLHPVINPATGQIAIDPNSGYALFNPNYQAFYTPLTPAQLAGFMQNIGSSSNTWINNTRATISNDSLFQLPGGNAGFAWLVEGGNQAWYEPLNPLISHGDVWGLTGDGGGGTRSHQGSAFELNLPLFKQLTFDLSGRYDRYSVNSGGGNHKFTYKAAIEYRPFETWLIRGNYATSFLAPDMSALFLGSSGFYQNLTDYYLCAKGSNQNCGVDYVDYGVNGTNYSNKKLQPTTSQSWTVGTVWSPINNLSLSVDYLHIAIQNEVAPQDTDLLMRQDAQCLLGTLPRSSAECAAVLGTNGNNGQVVRSVDPATDQPTGPVTNISSYYVNISNEVTDSITAEAKYLFKPTPIGRFGLQFDYNDMLKHAYQIYPGSLPINQLANPLYSSEFKNIASGALSWSLHDTWSSTLYWHRYSPTPNYTGMVNGASYPGAGRVSPWITWNWSLSYSPLKNLDLSLLVNNVLNKMPPKDPTYTTYPYFNNQNYNVYGREVMLQADFRFGGKGS